MLIKCTSLLIEQNVQKWESAGVHYPAVTGA